MLVYNSRYKVLICPLHKCAVVNPDEHLRESHTITGNEKDILIQQWTHLELCSPDKQQTPSHNRAPREWLAYPEYGFACKACPFLTKKWTHLARHGSEGHGWSWPSLEPVGHCPKEYAARVWLQTLFAFPHIRWFIVDKNGDEDEYGSNGDDDSDPPRSMSEATPELTTAQSDWLVDQKIMEFAQRRPQEREALARRQESQRREAPEIRAANLQSLFLARLPLEIRQKIYRLVLGVGTVFHIADVYAPIKPELHHCVGTDEHDDKDTDIDIDYMEIRDAWEDAIDEDLADNHIADETNKLRALTVLPATRDCIALVKTCSHFYQEASPILFSSNKFFVHTRHQNYATAMQFLSTLCANSRKQISAFGIIGLQPCLLKGRGRYGRCERNPDFTQRTEYYYRSEKAFLTEALPQLPSLNELTLGFDLSHLNYAGSFTGTGEGMRNVFSPQAFWLNNFLRLSTLSRIDLHFASDDWKEVFGDVRSMDWLIAQLNHVDGQNRIRAKFDWEDNYPDCSSLDSNSVVPYESRFPYNDIWA